MWKKAELLEHHANIAPDGFDLFRASCKFDTIHDNSTRFYRLNLEGIRSTLAEESPLRMISQADLDEFERQYLSLGRLAKTFGKSQQTVRAVLRRENVVAAFDPKKLVPI